MRRQKHSKYERHQDEKENYEEKRNARFQEDHRNKFKPKSKLLYFDDEYVMNSKENKSEGDFCCVLLMDLFAEKPG